jgi:hypothetical protein
MLASQLSGPFQRVVVQWPVARQKIRTTGLLLYSLSRTEDTFELVGTKMHQRHSQHEHFLNRIARTHYENENNKQLRPTEIPVP